MFPSQEYNVLHQTRCNGCNEKHDGRVYIAVPRNNAAAPASDAIQSVKINTTGFYGIKKGHQHIYSSAATDPKFTAFGDNFPFLAGM